MSRIAAILPAAGMGTRMGGETSKQFLELDGLPILLHTLRRLASCELITDIILATRADEVDRLSDRCLCGTLILLGRFRGTCRALLSR